MSLLARLRAFFFAPRLPPRLPPPRPALTGDSGGPDAELLTLRRFLAGIGVLEERPQKLPADALPALQRLARSDRAAEALTVAAALAQALPDDLPLQLACGEIFFAARRLKEAERSLERALTLAEEPARSGDSETPLRIRALLAEVFLESGSEERAVHALQALLGRDFFHPGARSRLDRLRESRRATTGVAGLPPLARAGQVAVQKHDTATVTGLSQGRYRLLSELGVGTSGTVYRAEDCELERHVALKLYFKPSEAERAVAEARLLTSVRHPGLIALCDYDPGGRYLTMELCEGGSLRTRLRGGPLPLAVALSRAREVAETLAALHRAGIAHGDVKPDNLLLRGPRRSLRCTSPDELGHGDLVLGDFGAARRFQAAGGLAEPLSLPVGTRGYVALERLHGEPLQGSSDLYSLGVLLAELCLGTLPAVFTAWPPPPAAEKMTAVILALAATVPAASAQPLRALLGALLDDRPTARPPAATVATALGALEAGA